jgi:hypothetical protein
MVSALRAIKVPISSQALKGSKSPRMTGEGENIRVYLRMRPLNDKEQGDESSQQGLKWNVQRESITLKQTVQTDLRFQNDSATDRMGV